MKMPEMKLNFRTLFWGGATGLLAILLAFAFWPQPVLIDMATVNQDTLRVSVRDEGRSRIRETYLVSAPLSGRVLRVGNRVGEHVKAGDVIASMLPADPGFLDERMRREAEAVARSAGEALTFARAELARAQAQLAHARTELQRTETLFARKTVAQRELDRARLQLRTDEAGVNTAQAAVGMREAELEAAKVRLIPPGERGPGGGVVELRAPISGRILRVLQQSESVVAPGVQILEIGDPGDLEVVVELLSSDAVQVKEGADARINAWGGGLSLRGRVRLVEPSGFLKISALGVEEQRVNVIIDFLDARDKWSSLGHGYRVEADITIWEEQDIIQAPVSALFRERGAWAVFKIVNGRARLTTVEIGLNDGHTAHILSGLNPGDRIIVYPGQMVSDGVRVRRRES